MFRRVLESDLAYAHQLRRRIDTTDSSHRHSSSRCTNRPITIGIMCDRGRSIRWAIVGLAAIHFAHDAFGQGPPFSMIDGVTTLPVHVIDGDVLSTLKPIVKRFDFEDDDAGANSLPPHFYRFVAPSQGFPPFGETRVVEGRGYVAPGMRSGRNGALEMDLQGGSMSVRIGTSVVPVLPLTDYVVACRVRTEGTHRAQARLIAWLSDSAGRVIEGSRVESRPARSEQNWSVLSVEVLGEHANAADLVFELQLIQPSHLSIPDAESLQPMVQDVRGKAWFDDITVSHLPRVVLELTQAGNIVSAGDPALFAIAVHELASKQLNARLRILDLDGQVVSDRAFAAPRGRDASIIPVALARCGWYRAVLDVTSDMSLSRRRWVDFLVVSDVQQSAQARSSFGVWLRSDSGVDDAVIAQRLRSGTAVVPAWHRQSTLESTNRSTSARLELVERLVRGDMRIAFSLIDVPEELIRSVGSQGHGAIDVLRTASSQWRPFLDDLLMHFGLSINDWVVGDGAHADDGAVAAARAALAEFVPAPNLRRTWSVAMQPPASDLASGSLLHVPAAIPHDSLTHFLEEWLAGSDGTSIVKIDTLPQSQHPPRQRLVDALLRGLHAWRAGADQIIVDQPWGSPTQSAARASPDPVALAWHTLSTQLAGRRFLTEIALGEGIHAWVAAGERAGDALLIIWSDRDPVSGTAPMAMQIGDDPLQMFDALGNASTIVPSQQRHHFEVGDLPIFLAGVSLEIVMFRSGMRIEPSFVPAAAKVHEHDLVIRNPWETAVSGSVRLVGAEDLQVSPTMQEFTIAAHGEARLPLQFVPQRGILAGQRRLAADITINADRQHALQIDLPVEVGLKDIELAVASSIIENPVTGERDLLISAAVTNRSAMPVHLDVDLLAEDISQLRRTIAALPSGQTQTRTFRISNGAALLAGRNIRIGVSQRDGVARLNRVIVIGEQGRAIEFAVSENER